VMDPNAAYREIKAHAREYRNGDYPEADLQDVLECVLESFNELDEWIKKGGYLPAEWAHPSGKGREPVESDDP